MLSLADTAMWSNLVVSRQGQRTDDDRAPYSFPERWCTMTQHTGEDSIVVGVDGSEPSHHAVSWAAHEARQRGATLRVVHTYPAGSRAATRDPSAVRLAAERLLNVSADQARQLLGDAAVVQELLEGRPAETLVHESLSASLLVVGSRGHGGFATLLLGSTSVHLTAHAACPVAVVRGSGPETAAPVGDPAGPIVVGVDDSPGAARALEFAFARAAERGASIIAMAAWQLPTSYGAYAGTELLQTDSADVERDVRERMARAIEPWQQRHPDVNVEQRTAAGHAVTALTDVSAQGAQFVVVGSHGRGNLKGLLLGSVSQGILRHAHSPVVVAR